MKNALSLGAALMALIFLAAGRGGEPIWKSPWILPLDSLGVWAVVTLSAYGMGRLLLARVRVPFAPGLETWVLKLGIGYGALGYLTLFAGLLDWLYPPIFWGLLSFSVFFSLRGESTPWANDHRPPWSMTEKTILGLLGLLVLIDFVLSLAPPTGRDVLTHHLALPKLYVQHHRIYDIPFVEASYNPMQVDMLYTLTLLLGSEEAASLIHTTFALMSGALIYGLLHRLVPRWLALMGSLLFLSTPLVVNSSSKAYVDLGLAFYGFAALYALLQEKEEERSWATFSAIFAGLAAATKYNGFLVLLLIGVWFILESRDKNRFSVLREGGKYFLIGLVVSLPWLLRNYAYTGNPLFPFFSNWVGNVVPIEQEVYEPLTRRALLYGEGWVDFLTIPIRMFFQGEDDIPRYFDGVLNPIFLFLSPLALIGVRENWRARMAGFVVFYFLFALLLVDMRARYILPTLGPLTVLSIFGLARLWTLPRGGIWVGLTLGLLLLNVSYLQAHIRKADLGLYLQGKECKEDYLSRKLGDYDLWKYANRTLPENSLVMMYFMGNRGYYCDRAYSYESYYSGKQLKQVLSRSPSGESLLKYFRDRGITHIALRRDLFDRFVEASLLSAEKTGLDHFWARFLHLQYSGKGYQLYQIRGDADASGL